MIYHYLNLKKSREICSKELVNRNIRAYIRNKFPRCRILINRFYSIQGNEIELKNATIITK